MTKKAVDKEAPPARFQTPNAVSKQMDMNLSTMMRLLGTPAMPGGSRQAYVKVGESYYPVGNHTIAVVDLASLPESTIRKYQRAKSAIQLLKDESNK